MKQSYLMALDQGTTSSRCILFDRQGTICSQVNREFKQYYPNDGWVEQDPPEIWASQMGVAVEAMLKLGIGPADVAAIGITNQRETVIVWERETGKPIHPAIVWQCRRTAEGCAEMKRRGVEPEIHARTGLLADPYFSATKLAWILDHVDGARARAERGELLFGTIDTWLIWHLTAGKVHGTDPSNAARTLLFNIHTMQWDEELLRLFRIPACMLPEVRPSSGMFGVSDPNLFGKEIPIAGVAGDQQSALFGQCCFDAGDVKNTYGTGGFLLMNTGDRPINSSQGLLTTVGWKIGGETRYVLEGSVFMCGAIVQWLRDGMKLFRHARDTEAMARSVADSAGVYLVPAFVGLGAPYWDAYARGRIIGDYRRIALYGTDNLILDKGHQKETHFVRMTSKNIRLREELSEQIRALEELRELGAMYGCDISRPAKNAREAVQWLYFGYLAAVKEQNGAAMSLGRTSTFLDIFIKRDMDKGILTESEAQELIDQFIMKLRIVKFARTPEYNALFSGDPTWVTESIGGVTVDGQHMVTKNSYRYLNTLNNLGTAPEPNMTVLWSKKLPQNFKRFCAKMSIKTSSIQYENDDLMRVIHGDDYAIACCVSSMRVGKEMQFFGARANLAKCLLYAINGGVDEVMKVQVGPKYRPVVGDYLDYNDVMDKYDQMMEWLAELYVNTLNIIHYMHDKYCYEKLQMALHDRDVKRYFATGIAGLSVVADSLSAIKYAKVKCIRDENGIVVDYETEGEFPKYGNDDDRVDQIAVDIVRMFMDKIRKHHTYRESIPTMSILTITSNVVYGKKTGNTPDGRKHGVPLAPGANPMHGRDTHGAVASLSSVSKLPFKHAQDGISNTFSIIPDALGKDTKIFAGDLDLDSLRSEAENED